MEKLGGKEMNITAIAITTIICIALTSICNDGKRK